MKMGAGQWSRAASAGVRGWLGKRRWSCSTKRLPVVVVTSGEGGRRWLLQQYATMTAACSANGAGATMVEAQGGGSRKQGGWGAAVGNNAGCNSG